MNVPMIECGTGRLAMYHEHIHSWYAAHGRAFPWRGERDAYRVLIAERMLHRTQARQVIDVYANFLNHFPSVQALATAELSVVRSLLASLGLPWRFESFVPMAQQIMSEHEGKVPQTREDLLGFPGVGPYVADAVLCFAFGQPTAVVDTNTIRVAGRYLRGVAWVGDERKRADVRAAVRYLLDDSCPAVSNHAILDLAAIICKAKTPLCHVCPVAPGCVYGRQQMGISSTDNSGKEADHNAAGRA